MTEDKALDLAQEALKLSSVTVDSFGVQRKIQEAITAITAIKQARALDKMAENARELGLDYEPVAPVREDWGPGPHECHSLTAAPVQEPDEWLTGCPECGMDSGCDCDSGTWNPPAAPVQEPVWIRPDELQKAQKAPFLCRVGPNKRDDFVPLYPAPPAAQRQWVGLTDAEVMQTMSGDWTSQFYFARAIEAKLKELNT